MTIRLHKVLGFILYGLAIALISTMVLRITKARVQLSETMELLVIITVIFFVSFVCTAIAKRLGLFRA